MPKRKASEDTSLSGHVTTIEPLKPHKKSKKEALSAVKAWHDQRSKARIGTEKKVILTGGVAVAASPPSGAKKGGAALKRATISPTPEAKKAAASAPWEEGAIKVNGHNVASSLPSKESKGGSTEPALVTPLKPSEKKSMKTNGAKFVAALPTTAPVTEGKGTPTKTVAVTPLRPGKETISDTHVLVTSPKKPAKSTTPMSPLFRDAKPTESNGGSGGNAFLRLVRKEKEVASPESAKVTASSTSSVTSNGIPSGDNISTEFDSAKSKAFRREMFIGGTVYLLFFFIVCTAIAFFIHHQKAIYNTRQEDHALRMEELNADAVKIRKVEADLQRMLKRGPTHPRERKEDRVMRAEEWDADAAKIHTVGADLEQSIKRTPKQPAERGEDHVLRTEELNANAAKTHEVGADLEQSLKKAPKQTVERDRRFYNANSNKGEGVGRIMSGPGPAPIFYGREPPSGILN